MEKDIWYINIMDFEPRDRSKMEKIEKINFLIKIVDSNK